MHGSPQLVLPLAQPPAPRFANFFPGANGDVLAALGEFTGPAPRDQVVYLWGPPGSGRTHLAQAAIAAAREHGLELAAAAATPLEALHGAMLLVLDDVERLDAAAQRAVVERFIALRAAGGRVLAAGDRPAAALPLRDDLRSRIASGIAFELKPLSDTERFAALHAHAAARGMRVADELIDYVARRVRRDMGTLVAVLDALDTHSLAQKRPLTLPLAREVLRAWEG